MLAGHETFYPCKKYLCIEQLVHLSDEKSMREWVLILFTPTFRRNDKSLAGWKYMLFLVGMLQDKLISCNMMAKSKT